MELLYDRAHIQKNKNDKQEKTETEQGHYRLHAVCQSIDRLPRLLRAVYGSHGSLRILIGYIRTCRGIIGYFKVTSGIHRSNGPLRDIIGYRRSLRVFMGEMGRPGSPPVNMGSLRVNIGYLSSS